MILKYYIPCTIILLLNTYIIAHIVKSTIYIYSWINLFSTISVHYKNLIILATAVNIVALFSILCSLSKFIHFSIAESNSFLVSSLLVLITVAPAWLLPQASLWGSHSQVLPVIVHHSQALEYRYSLFQAKTLSPSSPMATLLCKKSSCFSVNFCFTARKHSQSPYYVFVMLF